MIATVITALIGALGGTLAAGVTGWFLLRSKLFERTTQVTIQSAGNEVTLQALLREHTEKFFDRYVLEIHEAENKAYIAEQGRMVAEQGRAAAEQGSLELKARLEQALARAEMAEARATAAEARAEKAEAKATSALLQMEMLLRRYGVLPTDDLADSNAREASDSP